MKYTKCFIDKNYPRPSFTRPNYQLLNGEWDFAFDEKDELSKNRKFLKTEFSHKIIVPYAYNTKESGINIDKFCSVVWYKKEFETKNLNKRAILHFDGVDYKVEVYLNGQFIGSHKGGYTRFSFDITNVVKKNNTLVVKCIDYKDPELPRGKQRWTYTNFSCFYEETTGIFKSVWVEYVSEFYLKKVDQDILFEEDSVKYTYHVNKFKSGLKLNIKVLFQDKLLKNIDEHLTSLRGSLTISLLNNDKILPMKFWSPGNPNLFDVIYTLYDGEKVIDQVGSYSSLVRFNATNNILKLNYWPTLYLKMILHQGYYPNKGLSGDFEDFEKDIKLLKEMGFNGVRLHQKIEDERFHYLCDVYGLVTWIEMPSNYVFSTFSLEENIHTWLEVLKQYRNFVSTMAFVIYNESWGIMHVSENEREQLATTGLYDLTKALVPNRMVISNDGWEHTKTDILTTHNYAQSKENIAKAYDDVDFFANSFRTHPSTRVAFADNFLYSNQPIIVSECGGISLQKQKEDKNWGYGKDAENVNEFYQRLEGIVSAIRENPHLSGYCITQIRDVRQETNGLMYEDGQLKFDINKIKEIISK